MKYYLVHSCNGNSRPVNLTPSHKVRRRTALPEELLYPIISSTTNQDQLAIPDLSTSTVTQEEIADSNLMVPPLAGGIVRVPSAPGSLKYVDFTA
jgi:hypothetical protein